MTRSPDPGLPLTAARLSAVADDAMLGQRYELGPRLGEGGMGVVYRARDNMLQRTVAIKVLRDGSVESARTATEVHLLAGLNHPSLVTLFDAHLGLDGPRYLVMEYVDGPTLGRRLESGPLSARTAAGMARDLGDALHAVHAGGIVHRDIKPSNVLLRASTVPGEEFHAKLADFGIAYLMDTTRLTTPGLVVGSAAYLSPEQVRGSGPAPASDIYALGLLLIECLTGRRAFAQTSVNEAVVVRLTQDPDIPTSAGRGWGALLSRMTARDPAQRPTAREVVSVVSDLSSKKSDQTTVALGPVGSGGGTRDEIQTSRSHSSSASEPTEAVANGSAGSSTTRNIEPIPHMGQDPHAGQPSRRHVRAMIAVIVLILLAIAVVVGLIIWGGGGNEVVGPTLPALQEPLQSHLQQLLQAVTP